MKFLRHVFLFTSAHLLMSCSSDPRPVLLETDEFIVRLNEARQIPPSAVAGANDAAGVIVVRYDIETQFKGLMSRHNVDEKEMQLIPNARNTYDIETRLLTTSLYEGGAFQGDGDGDAEWESADDSGTIEYLTAIWKYSQMPKTW